MVAKRSVLKNQMPLLITVAATAVLLTIIFFIYRGFTHSECDNIFDQSGEQVHLKLEFIKINGELVLGPKKVQELTESSQKVALYLKSCCIAHEAGKMSTDQFQDCMSRAKGYESQITQVATNIEEAHAAEEQQKSELAKQKADAAREAAAKITTPVLFEGAVDGSAGADVGGGFFVGATDEDNKFRLYDVKGGPSLMTLDIGVEATVKSALGLQKIKECDLEGAAKIGDLIFWIGSHGRDKDAKEKKERQVLFATKLSGFGKDAKLEIAGKVYTQLIDDFLKDSTLAQFNLANAAKLAPKAEGGLNIESLAADGDKLWIGFRNPQSKTKALLVPLLNPTEIIKGVARAKLGDPVLLNLGGLGVRDMVAWNDGFLIVAGDFVDRFEPGAKPSRVFSWKPGTDPKDIEVDFGDLNPEAIVIMGDGDNPRILILSDDGKYPPDPKLRGKRDTFRGVWLQQTSVPAAGGNSPTPATMR